MAKDEIQVFKNKRDRFLYYLEKARGNVTAAAEISGIGRASHYRWIRENNEYREAVEDIENATINFVESKLFTLINGVMIQTKDGKSVYQKPPDIAAIIFFLKTRGKSHGYIEHHHLKIDNDIHVVFGDEN